MTLEKIVRNNDNDVIGVCNEVRKWVMGHIPIPKIGKFKGPKVKLYNYDTKTKKINNKWFNTYTKYLHKNKNVNMSNVILAWTNNQCDEYNKVIRESIFGKKDLNKFEVGDILIMYDYYSMKTKNNDETEKSQKNGFCSSEQIKIIEIEHVLKGVDPFAECLPLKNMKIRNLTDIENRYIKTIKTINNTTTRKYNVWKLFVQKLSDVSVKDIVPEIYQMYVIDDIDKDKLSKDREFASTKIRDLRTQYNIFHKENIERIERDVIKNLWKEYDIKLDEPFANVKLGASITTHKGQGSTFYNVFIDMDDVLKNPDVNEAKRCIYTALTRTSNELHLLI